MLSKILGYRKSNARMQNNKLVLSLDNAMTPVMWVIDLNDTPSFILKVEETKDGYFALQKSSLKGDKSRVTEDLAFYSKKAHAIDAMERAAKAMGERTSLSCQGSMKYVWAIILTIIFVVFVTFIANNMPEINWNTSENSQQEDEEMVLFSQTPASNEQSENAQPPVEPSSDPSAVGVPLSADDFFNNQGRSNSNSGLMF